MISATAASAAGEPRLQALTWIAPGQEFEALSRQAATCVALTDAGDAEVMTGRALFNAQFLLGGQAARAGISCASCHSNGRRNPHFFLAGVSAGPGSADVSSSFFSLARANGKFDPKPIPDLALPGKVSRDPASGDLERFLRGLIVEEFSGREPGKPELAALAAYVRSLAQCASSGTETRSLGVQLDLVRDSALAAASMAERGEGESAAVLVSGVRFQLGLIDERYAGADLVPERRLLLAASRALQPVGGTSVSDAANLRRWLLDFDTRVTPRLLRTEKRSLYDPGRLAKYLAP